MADRTDSNRILNPGDFESAVEACGFGFFNLFLLLACLPGLWATVFEIATISYVFPAAECDLQLSLMEMGALNAITFGGTIVSALPWGFVADTFSRKYVLVFGLFVQGTITFLSSLSQTSHQLLVWKFFGGLVSCGPIAGFVTYISEFHGKKHRMIIVVVIGFINALPLLILPVIAHSIVPQNIKLDLGTVIFKSWQILIAITAVPALLSSFLLLLFPESPKFLMSQGKNDQAIKVFRIIYSMNKFQKQHNYPIVKLLDETPETTKGRSSHSRTFLENLQQFRLMCTKNYIGITFKACIMQFPLVMSVNSLSLWQPELSAINAKMLNSGYKDISTCDIYEFVLNTTDLVHKDIVNKNCVLIYPAAFYDSMVISASLLLNFVLASVVLRYIGNNTLLRIYLVAACVALLLKYWSTSRQVTILLASVTNSCGFVCITLVTNSVVNLYPTNIRTMTVIFLMSCGRLGGLLGNLILPPLMALSCIAVFVVYSSNYIYSLIISFFLPNTTEDSLK